VVDPKAPLVTPVLTANRTVDHLRNRHKLLVMAVVVAPVAAAVEPTLKAQTVLLQTMKKKKKTKTMPCRGPLSTRSWSTCWKKTGKRSGCSAATVPRPTLTSSFSRPSPRRSHPCRSHSTRGESSAPCPLLRRRRRPPPPLQRQRSKQEPKPLPTQPPPP